MRITAVFGLCVICAPALAQPTPSSSKLDTARIAELTGAKGKLSFGRQTKMHGQAQHMTGEQPRVLCLHFRGVGPTDALSKGLRAALDKTDKTTGKKAPARRAPTNAAASCKRRPGGRW